MSLDLCRTSSLLSHAAALISFWDTFFCIKPQTTKPVSYFSHSGFRLNYQNYFYPMLPKMSKFISHIKSSFYC